MGGGGGGAGNRILDSKRSLPRKAEFSNWRAESTGGSEDQQSVAGQEWLADVRARTWNILQSVSTPSSVSQ